MRDGGRKFGGLGVERAVNHVNQTLAKELKGMDVFGQKAIDNLMIELDGRLRICNHPRKKHKHQCWQPSH